MLLFSIVMLSVVMLSVNMLSDAFLKCYAECRIFIFFAQCRNAECSILYCYSEYCILNCYAKFPMLSVTFL